MIRMPLAAAGASLLVLGWASEPRADPPTAAPTNPASTASTTATSTPAATDITTLGEVVVTARRQTEKLQDVPQVVDAVSGAEIQKLNLLRFSDVQNVVPGLTLQQGGLGFDSAASLRGVSFNVNTGAQPTVASYLNDAPLQSSFLFQSLFDTGQIEVLKGPQGATRGISAPSGAITVTTAKPNLTESGGYLDATTTDQSGHNVQAAFGAPILKDMLAVRVAGIYDESKFNDVGSIHNGLPPEQQTYGYRVSLLFRPTSFLDASLVYQHLDQKLTDYTLVFGPGNGGANPVLTPQQRLGAQDGPSQNKQGTDVVTANANAEYRGQRLTYVGSYQREDLTSLVAQDTGNVLPGVETYDSTKTRYEAVTQEIRLASIPSVHHWVDYTVGGFYQQQNTHGTTTEPGTYLPGAFGPPGSFNTADYNSKYIIPIDIAVPSRLQELSVFGGLTFHLGPSTELSGGARHIFSLFKGSDELNTAPGTIAYALPVPCSALHATSTYPGYCDIATPSSVIENLSTHTKKNLTIYNVSLSHHFNRDLLAYVTVGSSFRPGPIGVGVFNATNNAELNALTFLKPETSTAYEVGAKTTFFNGRMNLNVALYRQDFTNLIVYAPNVPYLSNSGSGFAVTNFNFTANADAVVQGVDVDSAFKITPDWSVAGQISYADGHTTNGSKLPCNDSNFNGVPDQGAVTSPAQFPAGTLVALCSGEPIARTPRWNATVQSDYSHPINDRFAGFIRGLLNYYPTNDRAEPGFIVNSYALLNLYGGVRSLTGRWEISIFAKNVFDVDELLDRSPQRQTLTALQSFFPTDNVGVYQTGTVTAPREIGVNLHLAFGSR